jgi:hypothetical protein
VFDESFFKVFRCPKAALIAAINSVNSPYLLVNDFNSEALVSTSLFLSSTFESTIN